MLIIAGAGCSSFGDESATSDTSSPTDDRGAEDGGATPDTGTDGAPKIEQEGGDITGTPVVTVNGKIVDSRGGPVEKQGILAIDANGSRHETTTGMDGSFTLDNVARPYDVTLVSPDAMRPTFLDVTLTDLYVVAGYAIDPRVENHAKISVPIAFPACSTGTCTMIARATSPNGTYGRGDVEWTGGAKTEATIVPLEWKVPPASAGAAESGDLEVLAFEPGFSKCWHAKTVGAFTVTAGQTVPAVQISPVAIANRSTTVTLDVANIPTDWNRSMTAVMVLASGEAFDVGYKASTSTLDLVLPNAPGATYQVSASASSGVFDGPVTVWGRSSQALSPLLSVTTSPSLTLDKVPALITPTIDGTLSLSAQGYSWEAAPNGITEVTVGVGIIYTTGHELTFAKLAALGLLPQPGQNSLSLKTGHLKATTDDLINGNASSRKSTYEAAQNATQQVARHTVTQ